MNNMIKEEIKKDLKYQEKFIVLLFSKLCVKIYKKGMEKGVNSML